MITKSFIKEKYLFNLCKVFFIFVGSHYFNPLINLVDSDAEADRSQLLNGWDSDGMHPIGDEVIHSRRKAVTDWDTIAKEELQRSLLLF